MKKFLLPLSFILAAFFMLHSGINKIKNHYGLYFNGLVTQGVVISVSTKYRREKNDLHFLTVSYSVNNIEYTLKSKNGVSWPWVPEKNEYVDLIYNADAPEDSEVYSVWNFYVLPAAQLIVSCLLIVLAGNQIIRKIQ